MADMVLWHFVFQRFFIVAVFAGDLLESVMRIINQKITTFEQSAEINPSISKHYYRVIAQLK